ncbi:hypothetical protein, partial [Methanosarcina sp.]|uniref:hypothetical protein n=1 Tax=Methanosarcina sp. TaxID=2213 RepID=UPI002ABC084F
LRELSHPVCPLPSLVLASYWGDNATRAIWFQGRRNLSDSIKTEGVEVDGFHPPPATSGKPELLRKGTSRLIVKL